MSNIHIFILCYAISNSLFPLQGSIFLQFLLRDRCCVHIHSKTIIWWVLSWLWIIIANLVLIVESWALIAVANGSSSYGSIRWFFARPKRGLVSRLVHMGIYTSTIWYDCGYDTDRNQIKECSSCQNVGMLPSSSLGVLGWENRGFNVQVGYVYNLLDRMFAQETGWKDLGILFFLEHVRPIIFGGGRTIHIYIYLYIWKG